jgi:DNA-binding transcriptional regulator YiaG
MMGDNALDAALLEHLPAAVVVTDGADRAVYCNRVARLTYRCVVGQPLPPELALAARNRTQWQGDVRLAGRRIHCSAAPVRGAAGNLIGTMTVCFEHAAALEDVERRRLGRRIARARAAAQLTQQQLAAELGVTRRSVQGYESGAVAPFRHLDRLAQVLECPELAAR